MEETLDLKDVVVAVVRTDEGMTYYMNPKNRGELVRALGEVQIRIMTEVIKRDGMAKVSKVVKPGGIMNFARGRR